MRPCQRSPVHVLRQVGQTVVAQVQQLQAVHPQGADGDRGEPVLCDVEVNHLLEAAQLTEVRATSSISCDIITPPIAPVLTRLNVHIISIFTF